MYLMYCCQQPWHRIMKLVSSKAAVLSTADIALHIQTETSMHAASVLWYVSCHSRMWHVKCCLAADREKDCLATDGVEDSMPLE